MSNGTDPVTLTLTTKLPFILFIASICAWPIAELLLKIYKRAVLRTMSRSIQSIQPLTPDKDTAIAPSMATTVDALVNNMHKRNAAGIWHQLVASLVYGLFISVITLFAGKLPFSLISIILQTVIYCWPGILIINVLYVSGTQQRIKLLGLYLGVLIFFGIIAIVRNTNLTIFQIILLWIIRNGPATVLLSLFLHRRIRAVGTMVVTLLFFCFTGSNVLLDIIESSTNALTFASNLGSSVGLNAVSVFILLIIVGFILFGIVGWVLLKWIGRLYEQKRINDYSLITDSVFLLFSITQTVTLAFDKVYLGFTGIIAFFIWRISFSLLQKRSIVRNPVPVNLLLLRVFSLGKQSERLFDHLTHLWRYVGPVQLIAGPDLITTTIEPHEMLSFAAGKLSRLFCLTINDVNNRFESMDLKPDSDNRYRVNEFFCHDTTWQVMLMKLLSKNHVVMLDLRSFSKQNQGCIYEIETLLKHVPLNRFVLLADQNTDLNFLTTVLTNGINNLLSDAVNFGKSEIPTPLIINNLGMKDIEDLLTNLFSAAVVG